MLSLKLLPSIWMGALVPAEELKDIVSVYSLKRNQDPAPRLHYSFLTAPPLFLHSLPSLISNYLNLPLGTLGRSWRLNEAYFLQTRNRGLRKGLYLRGLQGLAWFQ